MDNDEKIMLFFQLTDSSDPAEAIQILEQNNWDLDASVNHYLLLHDNQDISTSNKSNNNNGYNDISHGYSGAAGSGSGSGSTGGIKEDDYVGFDDENVRAPIPSTIETLVDGGIYDDPYYPASRVRSSAAPTTNVFEAFRDFSAEGKFGGANSIPKQTPKQQQLAKLFEPPYDILSFGTFNQVKKLAADSKLVLLIAHNNPEGVAYCSLYPVSKYPHISIIEPQTGMKKATHEGMIDSNDTYKFLQHYIIGQSKEVKKPRKYTSEEEELELAIQRSLGQDPAGAPKKKQVNLEEEEEEESSGDEAKAEEEQEEEEDSIDDGLEKFENPPPVVVPPMTQPDTIGTVGDCTIQIRLPGGEILKGQFAANDKIQKLYYFISVKKGINNFVLCTNFPKKELSGEILNRTLAEEELAPRAVLILQEK
ncbi:UAS domain-containing protein [Heterostelium album PN500]|uniref:UAS domain-containing protein n=1 Tax=Heterostelium pallidum (strain ATCC 26659 / Pp 5 / PN500) TaxID=670386 RepID=D3B7A4_HETP5|nr:UAS domain-containing protein [Heterostelium album PN500]EFA82647.1 UAS domain-containing protein [Heterostelium album PN500]|eukprot:XP_020434764.1 UAS domain-containing protein [Heterostelium album PN500]